MATSSHARKFANEVSRAVVVMLPSYLKMLMLKVAIAASITADSIFMDCEMTSPFS